MSQFAAASQEEKSTTTVVDSSMEISLNQSDNVVVTIVTQDLQQIPIEFGLIKMSEVIRDMVGDQPEEGALIPLQTIDSETFHLIRRFLSYHKVDKMATIPAPLPSDNISHFVSDWYAEFSKELDQNPRLLFNTISACNFLNIPPLLSLSCATLAIGMMNKDTEEIRTTYNIVDDIPEDEKLRIRQENEWINNI